MFCLLSASSIEHRNEEGHAFVLGIDGMRKLWIDPVSFRTWRDEYRGRAVQAVEIGG